MSIRPHKCIVHNNSVLATDSTGAYVHEAPRNSDDTSPIASNITKASKLNVEAISSHARKESTVFEEPVAAYGQGSWIVVEVGSRLFGILESGTSLLDMMESTSPNVLAMIVM